MIFWLPPHIPTHNQNHTTTLESETQPQRSPPHDLKIGAISASKDVRLSAVLAGRGVHDLLGAPFPRCSEPLCPNGHNTRVIFSAYQGGRGLLRQTCRPGVADARARGRARSGFPCRALRGGFALTVFTVPKRAPVASR
jgi:hypothetical protein